MYYYMAKRKTTKKVNGMTADFVLGRALNVAVFGQRQRRGTYARCVLHVALVCSIQEYSIRIICFITLQILCVQSCIKPG